MATNATILYSSIVKTNGSRQGNEEHMNSTDTISTQTKIESRPAEKNPSQPAKSTDNTPKTEVIDLFEQQRRLFFSK
jgi:hypothetical protein